MAPTRRWTPHLEGNLGNDVLPSPAMTTQPGWEPRPGPTRGETARRAPRGAAGGWQDDPARRRAARPPGSGRPDPRPRDPRGRDPRTGPGWGGPDDRGRGGPRPPRTPRGGPGDGASGGSGSRLRFIGAMSTRAALLALVAATLIGIVATLVAGSEPGFLLSLFIIIGAVIATLGVRPGAVYLFFPLPAFAFFAGAVITGKIHDRSLASSTLGEAAGFTQWIAGVFFPMCAATILVLVIGGARWVLARQLVGGQFPMSDDRQAAVRGPPRRPIPGPTRTQPGGGRPRALATPRGPAPTAPVRPGRPAMTAIRGT